MATAKKINKKNISVKQDAENQQEPLTPETLSNQPKKTVTNEEKPAEAKKRKTTSNKKADDKPEAGEISDKKIPAKKTTAKKRGTATEVIEPGEQTAPPKPPNAKKSPVKKKAGAVKEATIKSTVEEKTNDKSAEPTIGLKKIIFQLRYHTKAGENIFVTGSHPLLGNDNIDEAFALQYLNEDYWFGELDILPGQTMDTGFAYKYLVKRNGDIVQAELLSDKYFDPAAYNVEELRLVDAWNFAGQYENTFLTEPFKNVLLKGNYTRVNYTQPDSYTHIFRIKAPLLAKNQVIGVHGNATELGKWEVMNPLLMHKNEGDDWWTLHLDLSAASYPITYKYAIHDISTNQFVQMEGDKNRVVYDGAGPGKLTILSDGFAVFSNNAFKGAGVAIPVFSLRTNNGFGVGEFNDLVELVDWAKMVGLKVIQILPVNDTIATNTWVDSYPYAAISAFALHPLFLHLPDVASVENKNLLPDLESLRLELNTLDKVDYERVITAKLSYLKAIYPSQKTATFNSEAFISFFNENKHWLLPYAAFCFYRDEYGTPEFSSWPANNRYDAEDVDQFGLIPIEANNEISIHYFTQFHLHLQLKKATDYAHANGIVVKGDIPIGIYRNSADAWQQPELYNMDKQAGAPPDDFAIKGQNWGFPTYNWQRMQQDGFMWWKRRFAQMSYYFDAFRIDHILGFFRIWSIPMNAVEGIMGRFVPALPVYKSELDAYGINMDLSRLTLPYINEGILWQYFGELTTRVKSEFLNENGYEHYQLKPEFDTQHKVEKHFENLPLKDENQAMKYGLFNLLSNVILFEGDDNSGQDFHFRIAMDSTPSFQYLEGGVQAKLRELYVNYFFRRQDNFWQEQAMQKLPELKRSTNMLICGEDLGMVPDCVPGVMKQLGILSLEIQRMPKDASREFFHPNDAPYLSVVTPSTHDMSTIRGWWEEDPAKTRRFYNYQLGKWGGAPFFCEPEIVKAIIIQHLYSPAMLSIFQLQDLLGMDGAIRRGNPADERINIPANAKHYWQYRMHLTIHDLINQTAFNETLKGLVSSSGR